MVINFFHNSGYFQLHERLKVDELDPRVTTSCTFGTFAEQLADDKTHFI